MGTLTNSEGESSHFARPSLGRSEGISLSVIIAAVSRQRLPIFLASVLSAVIAYSYSSAYSQLTITAHLVLSKQLLPANSRAIYEALDPRRACSLLMSTEVLQQVCQRHSIATDRELRQQIAVTPENETASVIVDLSLNDQNRAIELLNEIGYQFEAATVKHRTATIQRHARHVAELKKRAAIDLGVARTASLKRQGLLRLNSVDIGQQGDDLQQLLNRHTQLADSLEECQRIQAKIQRELGFRAGEAHTVQSTAVFEILKGRQRQAERLRILVTDKSSISQSISDILQELTSVANELPEKAEGMAQNSREVAQPVRLANLVQTFQEETDLRLPEQTDTDELAKWVERISAIGHATLGNLSPDTLEYVDVVATKLKDVTEEKNRLLIEFKNQQSDAEYIKYRLTDIESDLQNILQAETQPRTTTLMDLQLEVSQKEARQAELQTQLDQINQLASYESPEYSVSSPAHVDPMTDIKSNKKKLFAFAFATAGLLLVSPSVFIELRRLRPHPVHVISQRWRLPILDHSSVASVPKTMRRGEVARSTNQELRLMALRIQQSLCLPQGRVILFSGLDHEESPLALIRPLAKCFADREESVLIVETMPVLVIEGNSSLHREIPRNIVRPGVADFLQGDYSDARSLVMRTSHAGVDFLPRGSTAFASEAIASRRLTSLIEEFRRSYSLIMLCGPSTLHPADLQMLAARADGIVFTVNRQSMQDVYGNDVMRDLIELGAPILGFAAQPPCAETEASTQFATNEELTLQTVVSGC